MSTILWRLINGCNGILALLKLSYQVSVMNVELFGNGPTSQQNGQFSNDGAGGMLEGKGHKALNNASQFVTAFVTLSSGHVDAYTLRKIHVEYIDRMLGATQLVIRS